MMSSILSPRVLGWVVVSMMWLGQPCAGSFSVIPNPEPIPFDQFGISVSISGQTIAVGSRSSAYLIDSSDRTIERLHIGPGRRPFQVTFAGPNLAVSQGEHVDVFRAKDGNFLRRITLPSSSAVVTTLSSAQLDQDSRLLVASDVDGTRFAHLYETTTGQLLQTFPDPNPSEAGFGREAAIFEKHAAISTGVGDQSGTVHLFDIKTGALRRSIPPPEPLGGFGKAIAMFGDLIVVGAPFQFVGDEQNPFALGRVYAYDVETGELIYSLKNPNPGEPDRGVATDDFFGASLAISKDLVVIGVDGNSIDDVAHIFESGSGTLIRSLDNPNTPFHFGPVDISGPFVVVGDTTNSDAARLAGASYVTAIPEPRSELIWVIVSATTLLTVCLRSLASGKQSEPRPPTS